jgi:hypothetical protein
MKHLALGLVALLATAAPGLAQTANLVSGEVRQAVGAVGDFGASCFVGRGLATFQRNAAAPNASLSFAELTGQPYRDLSGHVLLVFTTATAGRVYFRFDPAIASTPFFGYIQTYNAAARRLAVKFTIRFTGCDLSIYAVFDGA